MYGPCRHTRKCFLSSSTAPSERCYYATIALPCARAHLRSIANQSVGNANPRSLSLTNAPFRITSSPQSTRRINASDRTWAHIVRKQAPCGDGEGPFVRRLGMCLDTLGRGVQLRNQSNDDRCTRSTTPRISRPGRARFRAEQVRARFREESCRELRLPH